jgi:hypothetical protein
MTDRLVEIRERAEVRRAVSSRAIIDEHSEDADIFYLLDQIAERDAEISRLGQEMAATNGGYEYAVESKAKIAEQRDQLRYNLNWARGGIINGSPLAERIDAVLKEIS